MAEQFAVSRTSVREAIHVLVGDGLLEIKRGATGGAIVQDLIDNKNLRRLHQAARERRKDFKKLLEFRLVVECAAAEMAAERRTQADLKTLRRHMRVMDELYERAVGEGDLKAATQFYAEDTAYHIAIAKMTRNSLLLDTVEECRYKMFLSLADTVPQLDPHANDRHEEIYHAIEARDAAKASALMHDHIQGAFDSLFNR